MSKEETKWFRCIQQIHLGLNNYLPFGLQRLIWDFIHIRHVINELRACLQHLLPYKIENCIERMQMRWNHNQKRIVLEFWESSCLRQMPHRYVSLTVRQMYAMMEDDYYGIPEWFILCCARARLPHTMLQTWFSFWRRSLILGLNRISKKRIENKDSLTPNTCLTLLINTK